MFIHCMNGFSIVNYKFLFIVRDESSTMLSMYPVTNRGINRPLYILYCKDDPKADCEKYLNDLRLIFKLNI